MSYYSGPALVVGVSGSPASTAALRWAADEARRRSSRLVAVRAWRTPQTAFYAVHGQRHDTTQERRAATSELASTVRAVFGTKPPSWLFTEVIEGFAERVLVDQSLGADMLVLGSSSSPTLAGRSVGPVIRTCLSRAHCPVVVIGSEGDPGQPGTHQRRPGRNSARRAPQLVTSG